MTSAERLIKGIFDAHRLRILKERDDELAILKEKREEVPFRKLPSPVRQAFRDLVTARKLHKRAEATINKYGFHAGYEHSTTPTEVSRLTTLVEKEKQVIVRRADKRLGELESFRTNSYVAALGKTPTQAQQILTKFQKDAAQV